MLSQPRKFCDDVTTLFCFQAEQRKHEEEEQKKQDNELAFKAWLMKKREQCQEEKRVHRAQEMERLSLKVGAGGAHLTNPGFSFNPGPDQIIMGF